MKVGIDPSHGLHHHGTIQHMFGEVAGRAFIRGLKGTRTSVRSVPAVQHLRISYCATSRYCHKFMLLCS